MFFNDDFYFSISLLFGEMLQDVKYDFCSDFVQILDVINMDIVLYSNLKYYERTWCWEFSSDFYSNLRKNIDT